jgi:hypothetical protein
MKKSLLTVVSLVVCFGLMGCPSPRKTTNGTYHVRGETTELPALFKWDFKKGESLLKIFSADGRSESVSYSFEFNADDLIISKVQSKVLYTSGFLTALEDDAVQVLVSLWESSVEMPETDGVSHYEKYKIEVRVYNDKAYSGSYKGEYLKFKEYKKRETRRNDKLKDPFEEDRGGRFGRPSYQRPLR